MFRLSVLAAVAVAGLSPAWAQDKCRPSTPELVTGAEYAEARRPVIDKRKLSNEERAEARKLVSDIQARVRDKNYSPRLDDLEKLRVYGASGDREIMKALAEGYMDLDGIDTSDGRFSGDPAQMLAGLWGMQLYLAGDRSREMARAVASCLGTVKTFYSPMTADGTCGFDIEVNEHDYDKNFQAFAEGKGRLPKQVKFTEKPIAPTLEAEQSRFERALVKYRSGDDWDADQAWGKCFAERHGEDYLARWNGSESVASQAYRQEQENKVIRAKDELDQKAKAWTELQAKRVALKQTGGELPEKDYAQWWSLSFSLGGKHLEPIASEQYLVQQTAIDSLCRGAPGVICDRQRLIFQRLVDEARLENDMKEARWRAAIAANSPGSTTVRSYDQDGNYLGTTTMPDWQADILRGN